jgi:hypothetical protein
MPIDLKTGVRDEKSAAFPEQSTIECTFIQLKEFNRLRERFEKTTSSSTNSSLSSLSDIQPALLEWLSLMNIEREAVSLGDARYAIDPSKFKSEETKEAVEVLGIIAVRKEGQEYEEKIKAERDLNSVIATALEQQEKKFAERKEKEDVLLKQARLGEISWEVFDLKTAEIATEYSEQTTATLKRNRNEAFDEKNPDTDEALQKRSKINE